jgi:predicted ATP-grasp superfamily ATP-dependent carboligase
VDLVLAKRSDVDDVVVDVNPRLTTSYLALRHAARSNLAEAMLRVAEGCELTLRFRDRRVEFALDALPS